MTAQDAVAVSGVMVIILQVFKAAGLSGRLALLVAAGLSILGVGIWAYSAGTFGQATAWPYFAAWASVFSSSAGIFSIVNKTPETVTDIRGVGGRIVRSMTGTGSGT